MSIHAVLHNFQQQSCLYKIQRSLIGDINWTNNIVHFCGNAYRTLLNNACHIVPTSVICPLKNGSKLAKE